MERLCAIRKLGWKKVEVEKVKVLKKDIPNLLIQYNKQRVKTSWEILNEYHLLVYPMLFAIRGLQKAFMPPMLTWWTSQRLQVIKICERRWDMFMHRRNGYMMR